MQFGGPAFVLAIIGMSFLAWIITTAIRAKHGYPLENEWGGMSPPIDKQLHPHPHRNAELEAMKAALKAKGA